MTEVTTEQKVQPPTVDQYGTQTSPGGYGVAVSSESGLSPGQASGTVNGQEVERPKDVPVGLPYTPEKVVGNLRGGQGVRYQAEIDRSGRVTEQFTNSREMPGILTSRTDVPVPVRPDLHIAPQPRIIDSTRRIPTYEIERPYSKAIEVRPWTKDQVIGDIFGIQKITPEPGMKYTQDILGFTRLAGKADERPVSGTYDFQGERLDQAGKMLMFTPFVFGSLPGVNAVTAGFKEKVPIASDKFVLNTKEMFLDTSAQKYIDPWAKIPTQRQSGEITSGRTQVNYGSVFSERETARDVIAKNTVSQSHATGTSQKYVTLLEQKGTTMNAPQTQIFGYKPYSSFLTKNVMDIKTEMQNYEMTQNVARMERPQTQIWMSKNKPYISFLEKNKIALRTEMNAAAILDTQQITKQVPVTIQIQKQTQIQKQKQVQLQVQKLQSPQILKSSLVTSPQFKLFSFRQPQTKKERKNQPLFTTSRLDTPFTPILTTDTYIPNNPKPPKTPKTPKTPKNPPGGGGWTFNPPKPPNIPKIKPPKMPGFSLKSGKVSRKQRRGAFAWHVRNRLISIEDL